MHASNEQSLEDLLGLAPEAAPQSAPKTGKGKKKEKKSILGMEFFEDGVPAIDLRFMRPLLQESGSGDGSRTFGLSGDLHLEVIISTASNYKELIDLLKKDISRQIDLRFDVLNDEGSQLVKPNNFTSENLKKIVPFSLQMPTMK